MAEVSIAWSGRGLGLGRFGFGRLHGLSLPPEVQHQQPDADDEQDIGDVVDPWPDVVVEDARFHLNEIADDALAVMSGIPGRRYLLIHGAVRETADDPVLLAL